MGLDMCLERFPRYKDYGPKNIRAFEEYLEWKGNKDAKSTTLKEWCGYDEELLPKRGKDRTFLKQFVTTKYWDWDEEHRYPHERIYEQVCYWRKANAVHKWFVDRVQGGEDDCEYHDEVTKELLEELVEICKEILENAVLVKGKIQNGWRFENGKEVPIMEDGLYVANPEVCEDLPTQNGFFFGGTGYDEYYINDIRYTYEKLTKVLEETDFENQMLYYCSSW